ncbi:hypothetical protein BT96DRAFT_1006656 [Gymnopus androsaceus JB14]|uniref:Uncharacterized protein n=1 Tax=Gymnopus androsaceus JB14 TaxID=1447944 RepID=A0A6A4GKM9_9AGAR|nr:hypothetical protein BT96DRAFT_1006656 [Gymnopus androsaceus JB14]
MIELKSLVAVDEDKVKNGSESKSKTLVVIGKLESLVAVDDNEIKNGGKSKSESLVVVGKLESLMAVDQDEIENGSKSDNESLVVVGELKSLVAVDNDEIENGSKSELLVVIGKLESLAAVAAIGELESLVAVDDDEVGNGSKIGSKIESPVEELLAVSVVLVGNKTMVESLAKVSEDVSVCSLATKLYWNHWLKSAKKFGKEMSVMLVGERSVVALFEVADVSVGVEDGIVMDRIEMVGMEMVGRVMDGREKLKPVALVDVGLHVSEAIVDVKLDVSEAVIDVAGKTNVVSPFKAM